MELKCPKCGSEIVRTRITTNEHVCIKCGHIWPKKEEK